MIKRYNYVIIGGGIVGASTAMHLIKQYPEAAILLIEKEASAAKHQTGHNSGVIHAGVYYAPGSLKADFCKRGLADTINFCEQHDIAYDRCGKIIVATDANELDRLNSLYTNSQINELNVHWLEQSELHELEPAVQGIKGFLVKDTAITDYPKITQKMLSIFESLGGEVIFDNEITAIHETTEVVSITTTTVRLKSDYLIACAGVQADRIARMTGMEIDFRIVPFRGEYFKLPKAKSNIVKHLIYPVPDPEMPFLGVHLTNMIDGSVTMGPNAVLGLHREGYNKFSFNIRDVSNMLTFKGFWRVMKANLSSGASEMKNSLWKRGYLKKVQRYCPNLTLEDMEPYPPGIRAQAVMENGDLVHDFLFRETKRSLHVCNAPSPAATSAIPIGQYICKKVEVTRTIHSNKS